MHKSQIIVSSDSLAAEFDRCCQEYNALCVAVAWCGKPDGDRPYNSLQSFKGKIKATVGVAFNHTHPDAIEWFISMNANLRIFNDTAVLFHPKVYLFRKRNRYAVFIGSSNLTYGGFHANQEVNCLIEGTTAKERGKDIDALAKTLAKWRTSTYSFKPTTTWLSHYRSIHKTSMRKQRKYSVPTPLIAEDDIAATRWLGHADWSVYYMNILRGLKQHGRDARRYHAVLEAAAREIPVPWTIEYFKDIEKRRIIGGMPPYGWLGHVAASGQVRRLLAKGPTRKWSRIVRAVNAIATLEPPIPWAELQSHLERLVSLGHTMNVWGRVLCIVRPDLYCTVSAESVRRNLSKMLNVPMNQFNTVRGYIQLIRFIHSSPWFKSKKPRQKTKAEVWSRRTAFLDAVFY